MDREPSGGVRRYVKEEHYPLRAVRVKDPVIRNGDPPLQGYIFSIGADMIREVNFIGN